jgi:type IV secretory pathway VirB2 component (pilin)
MRKGIFVYLFLIAAVFAHASTLPGQSFDWITTVQGWLSGPVGISFGTIAIIVAGATIAITKGHGVSGLIWVLIGLGIAFGAVTFINLLFPNAGASGFVVP